MSADEIRIELGEDSFAGITIERLPAVAVGRNEQEVSRQARELADHPLFGADGRTGSRLVTRDQYLALRAAGAKDKTPWA